VTTHIAVPPMPDSRTHELIAKAAAGDHRALDELWQTHRARLRQVVELRLDPRVRRRVDPSDLVQETFIEAHRRLTAYVANPPLPFYPWLRQLALERLNKAHRRHLGAQARAVSREDANWPIPDESVAQLAERLIATDTGPMQRLLREETRRQVREALNELAFDDRQVLVMRVLEDLTTAETAAVLEISEAAVRMRQLRAIERLQKIIRKKQGPPAGR
jgi:RNA polymerase sigma-70 factor (ECF subfamily)